MYIVEHLTNIYAVCEDLDIEGKSTGGKPS